MHLPGPLRAAVGLAATAATEAKHLPDRAIELPMLVVSSALQASLRAQQRYARYAARGDEVLNRRTPTKEPPPWATFDEPVPLDELRRGSGSGGPVGGRSSFENLFGVEDPTVSPEGHEPVDQILPPPPDEPPPPLPTNAAEPAKKTARRKSVATKAAKKTMTKKAVTKKTVTTAAARKGAPGTADPATGGAKAVSKPRHVEPSAFDNVADD